MWSCEYCASDAASGDAGGGSYGNIGVYEGGGGAYNFGNPILCAFLLLVCVFAFP